MSDRKYRQRGYQDDSHDTDRRSGRPGADPSARPPRDPTLKPSGRGLGKPTATTFRCKVCGQENPSRNLSADAVCGHCQADLHTCTHCTHFDPAALAQCREPRADRIGAKAKRNECPFFEPRRAREFAAESGSPRDAKAAFDALFDF